MDDRNDLLKCCKQAVMYIAEEHYAQCPEIVLASLSELMFHFLHSLSRTTQKFAEANNRSNSNVIDCVGALTSFGFQVSDLIDAYLTAIHQSNTFRVAEMNIRPNTFFKPEKSYLRTSILDEDVKKDLAPISGPYLDAPLPWLPLEPSPNYWTMNMNFSGKSIGKLKKIEKIEEKTEENNFVKDNLELKIDRKVIKMSSDSFAEKVATFENNNLDEFLRECKEYFDPLIEKAENERENME